MALLNLGASAHRTMACRLALSPVLLAFGLVYYLGSYVVEAQPNVSRVVVQKRIAATQVSDSIFAAVSSIRPALAGFTVLGDYPSRTVFEGPTGSAQSLMDSLRSEGYETRLAADLDELSFLGHRIDPDTGAATPPFPAVDYRFSGRRGLFILVLRSYPTAEWLQRLETHGVRLVEAVSAAAYVARLDRAMVDTIKAEAFVRSLIPLTPAMKIGPAPAPVAVYRAVIVSAVEQDPVDGIRPFLEAYSERLVKEDRFPSGRVIYMASLADTEIATLSFFESVYHVTPVGDVSPSSERQGMLVLRPNVVEGRLELLEPLPQSLNYRDLLTPLGPFANTRVGIIDTGFDAGCPDNLSQCTASHIDFPSGVEIETEFPNQTDDDVSGHGTLTASLIAGMMNFDVRADTGRYRLGLGIAPGVAVVSNKFFACPNDQGDLANAIERLKLRSVNVINMSVNQCGFGTCGYSAMSSIVDWATRKDSTLFSISAGNAPECPSCSFVRGPATAKNAIAVGATESFTPSSWANTVTGGPITCAWNGPPSTRDARNIPSFSARRDPNSMVKPDLVAPGVRATGPRTTATLCVGGVFCDPPNQPPLAGYTMSAGTSFAAPAVAGAAAVVRRWFQNLTGVVHPSPAMVKAILINGARDIGGPPAVPPCPTIGGVKTAAVHDQSFTETDCIGHIPDRFQGWGMLNLERLLGPASNYYFSDHDWHPELSSAMSVWQTSVTVNDGSRPVRITLAYTDPGGNLGTVSPYSVKNDLSLGAFRYPPCNPCWYGNNINTTTGYSEPNAAVVDSANNVEQIIIPPGTYPSGAQLTVYVQATNLTEHMWGFPLYCLGEGGTPPCIEPVQDFALFAENAR